MFFQNFQNVTRLADVNVCKNSTCEKSESTSSLYKSLTAILRKKSQVWALNAHVESTIKEGQRHHAHLSSLIIAESRWFHGEFDCAQTVKWDTDCERRNEHAAVWSINKGSDWVICDSTLLSLTVNLPPMTWRQPPEKLSCIHEDQLCKATGHDILSLLKFVFTLWIYYFTLQMLQVCFCLCNFFLLEKLYRTSWNSWK